MVLRLSRKSVLLPNTHVYSKTEVQKELSAQGKKHLPMLPKGHFELIKVLPEGVGFALYLFDSVSRESPERTSTMCEALKDYGKAWGLTVEIGTGHISDKFCPFSRGGGGGGVTFMSLAEAVWQ